MPAGGGAEIGLVVRIDRTPENQFQYRVTKNSFKETRYVGALGGNRKVSRKDVRPSCAAVVILNGACGLPVFGRRSRGSVLGKIICGPNWCVSKTLRLVHCWIVHRSVYDGFYFAVVVLAG